jgi:hypothetical protein
MSESESSESEYAELEGWGRVHGVGGGGGVGQSGLGSTVIRSGMGSTPSRYFVPSTSIGSTSSTGSSSASPYLCSTCGRGGHLMEHCSLADSSEGIRCFWCGTGDHHFSQCARFRPGGAKGTCMLCHQQGHLSCSPYRLLAERVSCSNCGRKDHLGARCPDPLCEELLDRKVLSGSVISNRLEDRCHKCRQQGHSKSVCDKFRLYVTETKSRSVVYHQQ